MEKIMSPLLKVAEIQLRYRSQVKVADRPVITNSRECYEILKHVWDENKMELLEEFKVLLLNRASKVLGVYHCSSGGISGTVADSRLIFSAALKANSCSIILAHNHPSGNLKPSLADTELTQKMCAAGRFLDVKVLDHLILSTEGYYSFANQGEMS